MPTILFLIASLLTMTAQQPTDTSVRQEKLKVERLPDLKIARSGHCVFYAGGELTVVGGRTSGFVLTPTAEYFADGSWHLVPTVYSHDDGLAVVFRDDQRVLIAGGHEKNLGIGQTYEAEMYYPETHSFDGFGCLDRKRALAQGVELSNGEVLIVGNHQGNDAFELFDGHKSFRFVKDVEVWHSAPYILPVGEDDAIVFGSVWRDGKFQPCDTVLRLKGPSFSVPLLKEWNPILFDQNSHCESSFIGDRAKGDYSYLVAALDSDGAVAFLYIRDTVFSLLPTSCPVPMESKWGPIRYHLVAVADRSAQRSYLVGEDSTRRVYVVAVDYAKRPAPITLYCSDPLPSFGDATPVLTPDGNLVIAGGILDNNFSPFSTVWLLKMSDKQETMMTKPNQAKTFLWILAILLLVTVAIVGTFFVVRRHKQEEPSPQEVVAADHTAQDRPDSATDELMARIVGLMETERMYLNPELKVSDVAEALGVPRNAVSNSINSHQGCTFSQFVNDYRMQHAKKLLLDDSDLKISAVGLYSGFANERSFFRAFKSSTGMTPTEWKSLQDRH